MTNLELTEAFLRAFETRDGSNLNYYSPDVVFEEKPNRLVPAGATLGLAQLRLAAERGKQSVAAERYEILRMFAAGDTVAAEVMWTGKLNIGFGSLKPGDSMRAHLAMFLTWKNGQIVAQRQYDCYEAF